MNRISHQTIRSTFSGLWLDDPARLRDPEYRSALLFLVGPDRNYIVRFNLSLMTEEDRREFSEEELKGMEETAGDIFVWDYTATPSAIIQHPRGMEEDVQVKVPWRIETDGALALKTGDNEEWEIFRPAVLEDLYGAGFSRKFVNEVLQEIKDKGWTYRLICAIPSSAAEAGAS